MSGRHDLVCETGSAHKRGHPHDVWAALGRQLRRPSGVLGRAIGTLMDTANARPIEATIDAITPSANARILEIGFGTGRGLKRLLSRFPDARVDGIDHAPDMVRVAARRNAAEISAGRLSVRRAAALALPFADDRFDAVVAMNVAYFFDPDGREVMEIHRVLKPGGTAALYVTARSSMQNWRFAPDCTHRKFNAAKLASLVRQGGFQSEHIQVSTTAMPFGIEGLVATARRVLPS